MRNNLFQINGYVKEPLCLPDPVGPAIIHTEKVYVPVKEHPEVSLIVSKENDVNLFVSGLSFTVS